MAVLPVNFLNTPDKIQIRRQLVGWELALRQVVELSNASTFAEGLGLSRVKKADRTKVSFKPECGQA
jgi:hypothetical protein